MDDNKPISMEDVAGKIVEIAEKVPDIVGKAIQTGYQEAVKAYCGFCGEVTIKAEEWESDDDGSEKATSQIKMPGVGENDVVIFSPKTAEDRRRINSLELFISPIISVQDVENDAGESSKVGVIDVSCESGNADITLVYSVMRTSMATIQNSTTENPDDGDNTDGSGDQDGGDTGEED